MRKVPCRISIKKSKGSRPGLSRSLITSLIEESDENIPITNYEDVKEIFSKCNFIPILITFFSSFF